MIDLFKFAELAVKVGRVPPAPPAHPSHSDDPRTIALIDDFEERTAILTFDAHMSRDEAERMAHIDVFGRVPL